MFAIRLKELRLKKRLTQKELAEKLNMQNTAISKYELNERKPDTDTLIQLSKYFNVSVDYLLGNDTTKNSESNLNESNQKEYTEFETPQEAMKFILNQNVIMGFGGFDAEKMSDEEILNFANELLYQLQLLGYKYKK